MKGTTLAISDLPDSLGTNMVVGRSAGIGNPGAVTLDSMWVNLALSGATNYIDVQNGGSLQLNQQIPALEQNLEGGIEFFPGAGHTGTLAVQVDSGGTLQRDSSPLVGTPDQVMIGGTVSNSGTVQIMTAGNMLNITGQDGQGRSYWQTGANAVFTEWAAGSNILASGTYRIDGGSVYLPAQSVGGTSQDALDGAGLIFGNANNTNFTIQDSGQGTGVVGIGGPVTLAANTTTDMNFSSAHNTNDVLNVQGGALTLAGMLALNSVDTPNPQLPSVPLSCFEDFREPGTNASLSGSFASITNSVKENATYNYWVNTDIPNDYYWELTIH